MITIYKKKQIPKNMELIVLNDIYFNKFTVSLIDDKAAEIISKIDNSVMLSNYTISSKFDGGVLNIDKLSTGCKTVLNVLYNPDKIFDIRECGDNAIDVLYGLQTGNICCDYPLISFDMIEAKVYTPDGIQTMSSYDELKEWWSNED
jgi:hypothetical protein